MSSAVPRALSLAPCHHPAPRDLVEIFHRPLPDRWGSARTLARIMDEVGARKGHISWYPTGRSEEEHVLLAIDEGGSRSRAVDVAIHDHPDAWGRRWSLRLRPGRGERVDLRGCRGLGSHLYSIFAHLGRFLPNDRPGWTDQDQPLTVLINVLGEWIDQCWSPPSPWREQALWRMRSHAALAEDRDDRACLEGCADALEGHDLAAVGGAALDLSGSLADRDERTRAEVMARIAHEAALRILDVSLGAHAARTVSVHLWAQGQEHESRRWGECASALDQVASPGRVIPVAPGVLDLVAYRLARADPDAP